MTNTPQWQVHKAAVDRGWTVVDYQRVKKKLKELCTPSLEFDDAESLAYMLEEPLNYKLWWSVLRCVRDDNFCLVKRDNYYILDYITF